MAESGNAVREDVLTVLRILDEVRGGGVAAATCRG